MTPIQQLYLGVGAKKKTYVDDVFNNYLYTGDGNSTKTITTGIDLSGEGGLTWIKHRGSTQDHVLFDTIRGATKKLVANKTSASATDGNTLKSFTSTGFTIGSGNEVNQSSNDFVSWSFRKAPGFFDIVTYTGNGSARTISHSLGCQPGRIIIKCTSKAGDWLVNDYAWDHNGNLWGKLNSDGQFLGAGTYTGSTAPTSTNFTLGSANEVNENGETFVAYIFAGGDRTGNASVEFQGQNGYLKLKDSSDWLFSEQYCLEYWMYVTDNSVEFPTITWGTGAYRAIFWSPSGSEWKMEWPTGNSNITLGGSAANNTWQHHVITKDGSNVIRFFINGVLQSSHTNTDDQGANETMYIGYKANVPNLGFKNGKLSNVRIVNGSIPTTYQTSSTTNGASIFTSPTAPLTKSSQGATAGDVKLLCCNDIGASQYTYINDSPGMTNVGKIGATGSTESPFSATLDTSAVFNGDKPIIRTGQYMGTGDAESWNVDIGFEPQFVMVKRSGGSNSWFTLDSIRGIHEGSNDAFLNPNADAAEAQDSNYIHLTSTGFRLNTTSSHWNTDEAGYVYLAIRRPDGYVQRPVDDATKVFAMDTGGSSSTIPDFDSGFPVDMALLTNISTTDNNFVWARLTGKDELRANATNSASTANCAVWDSNAGFGSCNFSSNSVAWMFRRHAGFDNLLYTGDGVAGRKLRHGLAKAPEMIWIKRRNSTGEWIVGHDGVNSGTNPWEYEMLLHSNLSQQDSVNKFNDTAPDSSHFTIGNSIWVNGNDDKYVAFLFASVDGISKVGRYDGNNSSSGPTVTTGFSPRFLIIKRANDVDDWFVFDTLRGINNSGNDARLKLNENGASTDGHDWLSISSTGFTLNTTDTGVNASSNYIYYAHA